jgi:hypothetical protein
VQVHQFEIPSEPGQTHWRHIISDLHLESPESDHALLREHLDISRRIGARILINGDVNDSIWPGDKRFTLAVLRPELRKSDDVLAAVVDYSADILGPYADLIDVIGNGNHERKLHRYNGCDPIRLLIDKLNARLEKDGNPHRIRHGGVSGFVLTTFRFPRPGGSLSGLHHRLLYFHGAGGESPVTKGTINVARIAANWDYDMMTFGHKHNRLMFDDVMVSVTRDGRIRHRQRVAALTGSYVQSYRKGSQRNAINYNYSEDFISSPKPLGGLWASLTPERRRGQWRVFQEIHTRPILAEAAA